MKAGRCLDDRSSRVWSSSGFITLLSNPGKSANAVTWRLSYTRGMSKVNAPGTGPADPVVLRNPLLSCLGSVPPLIKRIDRVKLAGILGDGQDRNGDR